MALTIFGGGGLQAVSQDDPTFYAGAEYAGFDITATQGPNALNDGDWSFGGTEQVWVRNATADDAASMMFANEGDLLITQPGLYRVHIGVRFDTPPDRTLAAWVNLSTFGREMLTPRAGGSNGNYFLFGFDEWVFEPITLLAAEFRWPSFGTATTVSASGIELELFRLAAA